MTKTRLAVVPNTMGDWRLSATSHPNNLHRSLTRSGRGGTHLVLSPPASPVSRGPCTVQPRQAGLRGGQLLSITQANAHTARGCVLRSLAHPHDDGDRGQDG